MFVSVLRRRISEGSPANFSLAVIVGIYFVLSVQHPFFNFDDLSLLGSFRNDVMNGDSFASILYKVVVATDLPHEYRTYSFSRAIQCLFFFAFGENAFFYFAFMAATHIASAFLIIKLVRLLSERRNGEDLDSTAVGCAAIFLFSPFSMCRTFHHFSYILLPFFFLLLLIVQTELSLRRTASAPGAFFRSLLLVPMLCLSGEATLPTLFCYLIFVGVRRPAVGVPQMFAAVITLIIHYEVLASINGYAGASRFALQIHQNDLIYFLHSVLATIRRGLWLSGENYEAYFPGAYEKSYLWSSLNLAFALLILTLCVFIGINWRVFRRTFRFSQKRLLSITLLVSSLWSLYFLLTVLNDRYVHNFGLQARYGYVVLPASFLLLFLWMQQVRALALASWAIPIGSMVIWSAVVTVAVPSQARIDNEIVQALHDARTSGAKAVLIDHRGLSFWSEFFDRHPHRTLGLLNPFLLTIDTPFQYDWTTRIFAQRLGYDVVADESFDRGGGSYLLVAGPGSLIPYDEKEIIVARTLEDDPFRPRKLLTPEFIRLGEDQRRESSREIVYAGNVTFFTRMISGSEVKAGRLLLAVHAPADVFKSEYVFVHFLDSPQRLIGQADFNLAESFLRRVGIVEVCEPPHIFERCDTARPYRLYKAVVPSYMWTHANLIGLGLYSLPVSDIGRRAVLSGAAADPPYEALLSIR